MFEQFNLPKGHMVSIDDLENPCNFEKLFQMIAHRRRAQIYLKALRFVILFFLLVLILIAFLIS